MEDFNNLFDLPSFKSSCESQWRHANYTPVVPNPECRKKRCKKKLPFTARSKCNWWCWVIRTVQQSVCREIIIFCSAAKKKEKTGNSSNEMPFYIAHWWWVKVDGWTKEKRCSTGSAVKRETRCANRDRKIIIAKEMKNYVAYILANWMTFWMH